MDRYFPVISSASGSSLRKPNEEKDKKREALKYQPYTSKRPSSKTDLLKLQDELQGNGVKPSPNSITKFLLATLSDESNPITHSDSRDRADRIISSSTGHQVADYPRDRQHYMEDRGRKLDVQRAAAPESSNRQVLSNVRVYINGFLNNTTDIEMKKIVIRAGGQIVATASTATHILTSQQLSGSKTHKFLTTKSRIKSYVVRPEWVWDSIDAGRRQSEREYTVIKTSSARTMHDMLQK